MITAPSKQTPAYDFRKATPVCCVPSPANVESATGEYS